jgi:hypothetical protein
MGEGASIITSRPALFLGKAMNARMSLRPPRSATHRSKLKAAPPCGEEQRNQIVDLWDEIGEFHPVG